MNRRTPAHGVEYIFQTVFRRTLVPRVRRLTRGYRSDALRAEEIVEHKSSSAASTIGIIAPGERVKMTAAAYQASIIVEPAYPRIERRIVTILGADGVTEPVGLYIFFEPCAIVAPYLNGERHEFIDRDLFEALGQMRRMLSRQGARVLVNGARVDVMPSGMSRDMGGGLTAYVNRLGQHSSRSDLVDIFDFAASDLIGSIEEQRDYFDRWLRSIGVTM